MSANLFSALPTIGRFSVSGRFLPRKELMTSNITAARTASASQPGLESLGARIIAGDLKISRVEVVAPELVDIPGQNFRIMLSPVTVGQFRDIAKTSDWYRNENEDTLAFLSTLLSNPNKNETLTGASAYEAVDFVNKLNILTGKTFCIPTERELLIAGYELKGQFKFDLDEFITKAPNGDDSVEDRLSSLVDDDDKITVFNLKTGKCSTTMRFKNDYSAAFRLVELLD